MKGTKNFLSSKAVWGGLVAIVAGLAGIFGFTVGAEDQHNIAELLASAAAAIGGILAVAGRVVATKRIE